jgi:uncharacterized iron-regulated membrane protein
MKVAEILVVVVFLMIVLGAAGVVAWAMLRDAAQNMGTRRQDRREAESQRQLALLAPAALRGDPLLQVVIAQGKKLQSADAIFAKLIRNDIDVLMPTEMSEQIKAWQSKQAEEK